MSDTATEAIEVRRGVLADAPMIAAFNAAMAWETEKRWLDPTTVAAGVRAALQDPAKGIYFVASVGGQLVGQLMITHEWSDWRNGDMWWIQSVYVDPGHRRKGIFRALFAAAEADARASGATTLRLYVERHNAAAQRTYETLGMSLSDYLVMEKRLG
jgi:GNAT superfamily N-acetyltransferase